MKIKFNRIHSFAEFGIPDITTALWVDHKDIKSFEQLNPKVLTIYDNDGNVFESATYTGEKLAQKLHQIEKLNLD